jgi:hypothetical protein
MIAVAALVVTGAWSRLTGPPSGDVAARPPTPDPAPPMAAAASPATAPGTLPAAQAAGGSRLAGVVAAARRSELVFLETDRETVAQGRLRVHGRVRNAGGSEARQARVRVRVLLDDGQVAAQGETPLEPVTLVPGQIASFDLLLDYDGPPATIRSEVIWSE